MLTITTDNPKLEQLLANALSQVLGGITTAPTQPSTSTPDEPSKPETPTPKRRRSSSAEPTDTNKPVTENDTPEPQTNPDSSNNESGSSDPVPTVLDLRAKAKEVGTNAAGKAVVKTLLTEFGADSLSNVAEDRRVEFLARLEAL